jgi:von Willebrand factor type A domain-containing protein
MRNPLVLLPFALMAAAGSSAAESARIEIVLDVSGSMRSSLGSEVKIEAAKSAIRQTVAGIPDGSVVALRYYGHRVAQERKEESCRDTELVVQFQPLDKARFLGALDKAVPRGQTPIAYSLQQAAQDFGAPSDEERAMILVSDGIETCGGDPLATVRELTAKGFKVKVHTIGFDVDAAARAQLEAISGATGGEYFDARSASALAETLGKLTQRALLIKRDSVFGEEIRGGAKYDDAVAIKPAATYHLDHHQREDEYDYFVIEAREGQKIVASIQCFDKGVRIRGEKVEESGLPYAGIAIHAPDRRHIVDKWEANPGNKATVSVSLGSGQGGRFFILVGNEHHGQHQNSRFDVTLVDLFDANSGRDAGSDDSKAVDIQPGNHTGYLYANDPTDYYALAVSPGAKYNIRVKPGMAEKSIDLEVLDRDAVKVKEVEAPNPGAAVRLENIEFPYAGKAYLKLTSRTYEGGNVESPYALEVTQVGGPAPAATSENAPAASDKAAAAPAAATAPVPAPTTASGGSSPMLIGLGVLGVGVLVAGAYLLGKRK